MNRKEMLDRLAKGENSLELSTQKWQDIVDGFGYDDNSENCALCETALGGCDRCIIYIKNRITCINTPYGSYFLNHTKKNAQAVLDFLKSLRENSK